ncbi:hypothetical protein [Wenzhouxiangella sp. EGI_FJ10409]|uniref:hypothetical protein n=1 Tax=Wenzhouxiangella sp. EGI_FJ10409 TaxID=3243767 RepID=UPI0035D63ECA
MQQEGTITRVYANRWDGEAWLDAEMISGETGRALRVELDMNDAGEALVVWTVYEESTNRIYGTHWNGANWSQPGLVSLSTAGTEPDVALDESGKGVAVFQQHDGAFRVYANQWSGTDWGIPEPIDATADFNAQAPHVDMDGSGNAIAVWQQPDGDGSNMRAFANHLTNGNWNGAVRLSAGLEQSSSSVAISMNDTGHGLAIWRLSDGANRRIQTARFDGSAWSGALSIDPGSQRLTDPRIALSQSGSALAAWRLDEDNERRIFVSDWDSTSWTAAVAVDDGLDPNISNVELATDDAGRGMVSWNQTDGSRTRVHVARWNGSSWSSPDLVDAGTYATYWADVAMDDVGNGAAAWLQSEDLFRVYVARYSIDPLFSDRFQAEPSNSSSQSLRH